MKLTAIAEAIKQTNKPLDCFNLLIYGDPKTGKSELAATIAKVPFIKKVHFITIENGGETLRTMLTEGRLTYEEADKIIVYSIPDTKELPRGFETVVKMLTVYRDLTICEEHGKIDCELCADREPEKQKGIPGKILKYNGQVFNLKKCGKDEVVVVDNMSQLTRSIMAWATLGKGYEYKEGWDEFGKLQRVLNDVCGVMQACANTNFIATAHRVGIDFDAEGTKVDGIEAATDSAYVDYFPYIGSKNYALSVGGFFSHIIYVEKNRLNKHVAGSSTTYKRGTLAGSRGGWQIEMQKNQRVSLVPLFEQLVGKKV